MAFRLIRDNGVDKALLLKWLTTPQVIELAYGEDAPWDAGKIDAIFYRKLDDGEQITPCMILYDGDPIGYIQFYPIEEDSYRFIRETPYTSFAGGYGIDLFIGYPHLWGRGIGTDVVRALKNHLLRDQGATVVCADPEEHNRRSIGCWKKAGFVPVGRIANYDDPSKTSILMAARD